MDRVILIFTLSSYAIGELNNLDREHLQNLQPAEAMTSLGISTDTHESLLDPEHSQMFESEMLPYWLALAMRSRHGTVQCYLDILKLQAIRRLRTKNGKSDT